jgi:hypothetical protein
MRRWILAATAVSCMGSWAMTAQTAAPAAVSDSGTVEIPAGTKMLLSLKSAVNTKIAKAGDAVYLTSTFPVIVGDRVVLAPGVDVLGLIDSVTRPGKLKGRAQVSMHFTTLILPGGYAVQLPGSVNSVPSTDGPVMKGNEGKIQQQSSVGQDARNISTATGVGTGAGALASMGSSNPTGIGYGALAGGAGGIAYTLLTRGKDIELPVGEPIEMVFDRPLQLSAKQAYVPKPAGSVDYVPVPSQSRMLPKPTPPQNE